MINKLNRAFIFDLDGVITETSEYHFWHGRQFVKKLDMILQGKRMKN